MGRIPNLVSRFPFLAVWTLLLSINVESSRDSSRDSSWDSSLSALDPTGFPTHQPSSVTAPRRVCRVTDFGVTGTGILYDTIPLQSAIDFCSSHGGGVVHIPPGRYLTATLYLRSNITLWVEKDATLLGSTQQSDFPARFRRWYTILAEEAENVELTGGGVVDGQGAEFVVEAKEEKNLMVSWNATGDCAGDECRPKLVGFVNCKNVRVWNIFLREPAYWW